MWHKQAWILHANMFAALAAEVFWGWPLHSRGYYDWDGDWDDGHNTCWKAVIKCYKRSNDDEVCSPLPYQKAQHSGCLALTTVLLRLTH